MTIKKRYETRIHDQTLVDDYRWMRERDDQQVTDYLNGENERTRLATEHTAQIQETLFQEFKARLKETDLSVPVRRGSYFYYSRTVEGQQYPIYCRKKDNLQAEEQVFLDLNDFSQARDYVKLGVLEVSPDHRLLAYSLDETGSENFTLRFREIDTGRELPDRLENTYYSLAWANDNKTVFYTTLDSSHRPDKVFRHQLSSSQDSDLELFHEPDERFFVNVGKSKSEKFVLVELSSQVTTEVHLLDADAPLSGLKLFLAREQGVEYSVYHHGSRLLVLTNKDALNFRLLEAPLEEERRQPSAWREVIPHDPEVMLDALDIFRDFVVIYGRLNGLRAIRVMDAASEQSYQVEFDEPVYTASGAGNPEYDNTVLRFHYTSLVTPPSVFDFDMRTRERVLLKQKEVLGGFDPSDYCSQREWATATDGTRIPISIVYRKGFERDGSQPCLLYGYGSYGITVDPGFSMQRLSLLDRGFCFAIAHVRGGGAMGRGWYEAGKLHLKPNTFSDFVTCAEHLVERQYTTPAKLCISGGSAGGLLVGAVLNLRPELFCAAQAHVPFVDVVNTMLDDSIPLTVIEYEEWGNPNLPEFFETMLSYSPYNNVERKEYPHLLITAGLNDPRVQYWEPAKWTAKLRELKTDNNLLLLKTEMSSGHAGPSGRYDLMRETAFEYAFFLDCLGIGE